MTLLNSLRHLAPKLDVDLTGDSDDGGMAGAGVDAGAGGSEGTK